MGIFEIASQGGGMLGFWINYIVARTVPSQGTSFVLNPNITTHALKSGSTQWVIPLALQLVPGLLLAVGAIFSPESPGWLAKQNRWQEASDKLSHFRKLPATSDYVQTELAGMREQIDREEFISGGTTSRFGKFRELFLKGNRNRLAIGVTLMMCQNMTGVNVSEPPDLYLCGDVGLMADLERSLPIIAPESLRLWELPEPTLSCLLL